jgi:GTP-binding protein HflX
MARLAQSDGKPADCIFISATKKENIDALREMLYERVKELHIQRYPYNDFLFQKYE